MWGPVGCLLRSIVDITRSPARAEAVASGSRHRSCLFEMTLLLCVSDSQNGDLAADDDADKSRRWNGRHHNHSAYPYLWPDWRDSRHRMAGGSVSDAWPQEPHRRNDNGRLGTVCHSDSRGLDLGSVLYNDWRLSGFCNEAVLLDRHILNAWVW
jgi:hypothetical protein